MRGILSVGLTIGLSGCCHPLPEFRPADDPTLATRLRERTPQPPEGTRMTLRAILTTRGMELPLTLRIWRKLPDHYRLIAANDLGGTPVHVVQRGEEFVFVARSDMLDEAFVREGLCRDLAHCLFLHASTGDRAVQLAPIPEPTDDPPSSWTPGPPALHRTSGELHALLWASTDAGPIDRIAHGLRHRLHSMIELEWDESRPTNIHIDNHRFGFKLSLEVKEWQPADLTPKTFRTTR